jgi:hypothetical protein
MARAPQHQIKAASSTLKVTASEELEKEVQEEISTAREEADEKNIAELLDKDQDEDS